MVNIPYRSSESLIAARISERLSAMRRTAGAIVLALLAAVLIGILLQRVPAGGKNVLDFIPLDDPAVAAIFTA